jgi:hypothetical protein
MSVLHDDLVLKISDLKMAIASGSIDDAESQKMVAEINQMVPHAMFSDLFFYPDRDRSVNEMAHELLERESFFKSHGAAALRDHIRSLYTLVVNDPGVEPSRKFAAMAVLDYL